MKKIESAEDIHSVLVVGAGTMGSQIALQCALCGLGVTLYDVDRAKLDEARGRMSGEYAASLTGLGLREAETVRKVIDGIEFTTDAAVAAAEADLVSESIPERPELKARVFGMFDGLCPERTLFATNSSTLLPSMIAEGTGRPDRFCAMHFHIYVWVANVVDIMPHPGTAPEVAEILRQFALRIGQVPIVLKKEQVGYVFNTMLCALNDAALGLVADGVASVDDVDRAWMGVMKTPIGPLGILDFVGLDTAMTITEYWAERTGNKRLVSNGQLLRSYVEAGRLGMKNGKGFYDYPAPRYADEDFVSSASK